MKLVAIVGLLSLYFTCAEGHGRRFQRFAREKIHHKYRPVKETALLEKVGETESNEASPFGINWNELLNTRTRGTTKMRDLFSDIWSQLFGNGNSTKPTDVGVESPEEQSFFHGILDLMKPWWKGPNVCVREEESEEDASSQDFFSSLLTSCQDVGNAYKCTMKIGKDGTIKVRTLTYECCHGWARKPNEKGCTAELELSDMISTLREMNLTRFIDTVSSAGLEEKLEEQNFTVFVPTDEALAAVTDSEEISFVLLDTGDKMQFVREILIGHLLPGWHLSHEWTDEMKLNTEKDGSSVRINFYSYPTPFATVNCARILSADKQTLSGVIHTVDRVIMPARQTLWEILGQDPRFSVFSSIVSDELQEKLLDPDQHFTVLAFSDEEFEKLPSDQKATIRRKEGCFSDFAEQLIIPHTVCSAAVQSEAVVRNLAGNLINASMSHGNDHIEGSVSFSGIPVEAADRIATNGIVHLMGGVVMLDHMMSALRLAETRKGEVFAELVISSGLNEDLPDPVTLFVPPNEPLLDADIGQATEQGRNVLKNHIVDGLVRISRGNPESVVETVAGSSLSVKVKHSPFFFFDERNSAQATVGCARIIRSNVQSCNGILHFIDKILAIPTRTALQILRENEDVSEFVSLLEIAGIDSELNAANFSGTVLAPTNAGFEEHLSAEVKEKLLNEPEKLRSVLKQHILRDSVCCHELGSRFWLDQNRYQTFAGNYLVSSGTSQNRRIGGAFIVSCDHQATNGIIHTVDRPIIRRKVDSIFDLFSRGQRNFNWNIDWPF